MELENSDQPQKGPSPLVSLEKDLKLYNESIREVAADILEAKLSDYPIFVAHQHEVSLGQMILNSKELKTSWNINAATLEEFIEKNVIAKEREEYFVNNYKDPEAYMCLFVIVPEGANFVFYPYK
ncbi:hypothetical protein [Solitalea canadensis]|uniref:Uncharacterized protein n=1 Tax=Solitalea canadensis (strain ATCC 29591 / DSM 3403 / JCM 21819 / LMG 8368 / NBRC 15130 / NCIMB 12057 / USAM 9D) TaxID=929556 RepID=H8KN68_SOLCM|nr:hypothetical protein [Solitalea canadensis]AFD09401.1 hypothetical protein Solca_4411 [Solitalea canadensis DSM 3403]